MLAATLGSPQAAERRIDLDGNPLNGEESKVQTKIIPGTFPVKFRNTIFNNTLGESFTFDWPGAGFGGFASFVGAGPGVGTVWTWTTVEEVFSIDSPITFLPARTVPVFGAPTPGVQPIGGAEERVFVVPGKSLSDLEVTITTAELVASLITFFSPQETLASCGVECDSGTCEVFLANFTGVPVNVMLRQDDCCMEPQQIFCDDVCTSYLTDTQNCGGCGIQCGPEELCTEGVCACPEGLTQCGEGCEDLQTDPDHCADCLTQCALDQFCSGGACLCSDAGFTNCDGTCQDLQNDDANCGGCGFACEFDEFCSAGVCEEICPGQTLCGEECVDLDSDVLNCGACGNACGSNDICTAGQCFTCRPPQATACDNECVSLHKDPLNCGACGFVCDFSGCPSEGQGACSQGSSCICDPGPAESSTDPLRFDPVPTERPGRVKIEPLRSLSTEAPPWRAATRSRPATSRAQTNVPAVEAAAVGALEEAALCDLNPISQIIPDGATFTQPLATARYGREGPATVVIELANGQTATGPCPVVVPVQNASTEGVILSPVAVATNDFSGNFSCEANEPWCDYLITAVNVGDSPCINPLATLSSPPNQFNPNTIVFNNALSPYSSWPAYPGEGLPLQENTNTVAFSITPTNQAPGHARPFLLTVECMNLQDPVLMPIALGFGEACDPATDLDGQTFDGIDGLRPPVDAALVPQGRPVNFSDGNFNHGSTIPMTIRLSCGAMALGDAQIDPHPQIVGLVHESLGPQSLQEINGRNNANPDDPLFSCSDTLCDYQFRTEKLPSGTYVISIQLPDSRVFDAGFTIGPE
ncbi:MAG: hypothetical protein E2P04_02620 [Acidobacteria bacterium]|nr:MAG: hypothetical protein E2P04_02620 [Acidobacteriota bacterium]